MEREVIEFDVVFVGGGPANLSSAIHLTNLIHKHNKDIEDGKLQGGENRYRRQNCGP